MSVNSRAAYERQQLLGDTLLKVTSGGQTRTGNFHAITSTHVLLAKVSHMAKCNINEVGNFRRRSCKVKWQGCGNLERKRTGSQ